MHRSPGVFFDHDKGKTHASGNLMSMQLPFMINAGLYAEAEDLINFINDFLEFDTSNAIGRFQEDLFNFSMGRINLVKKDYRAAIYNFEIAKLN